jgi:prevent-host-death family protein
MVQAQAEVAEETIYRDIYQLREFNEDPSPFLRLLRTTHSHVTLTLNGTPAAVVLDPAEYQRLLDLAADADVVEGIRQGNEDMLAGRTRLVDEVFDEILAKYASPR